MFYTERQGESHSVFPRKSVLHYLTTIVILAIVLMALAACANASPIDTGNPTTFKHRTGAFSLQAPQSWKRAQDAVETESVAAFSDPTQRAELLAYAGLLDHRLTDGEGNQAVAGLAKNLLNAPSDLKVTDQQRRTDGAFMAALSFTRAGEKRSGVAIFRDEQLALAGVILDGPEAGWADFQKAMQPYLDSFQLNPDVVQGTYFTPLEGDLYALVVPAGWQRQPGRGFTLIHSSTGRLTIIAAEKTLTGTLDTAGLVTTGMELLQQSLGTGKVSGNETLPDGRIKVTIDRGSNRTIGYLDQKDGGIIGLFFDVPADRVQDYQPFIDFVYSTFITGKS